MPGAADTLEVDHSLLANGAAFGACFAFGFLVSGRRALLGVTTRGALCLTVAALLAFLAAPSAPVRELAGWGAVLGTTLFAAYLGLDVLAYARRGLERS